MITLAELPEAQSFPQRPLFPAVGLDFGMLLGGAGALMRKLLTSGFMTERQVEETLEVPFWLPRQISEMVGVGENADATAHLSRTQTALQSEAIRRLRALLEPMLNSRLSANPVLVTSALSGADIAASIEHALVAHTERLRLTVVQVNAGYPPDKIAAEILQSLFAARQAPAPQ